MGLTQNVNCWIISAVYCSVVLWTCLANGLEKLVAYENHTETFIQNTIKITLSACNSLTTDLQNVLWEKMINNRNRYGENCDINYGLESSITCLREAEAYIVEPGSPLTDVALDEVCCKCVSKSTWIIYIKLWFWGTVMGLI